MRRCKKQNKGFTLIELLIATSIFATVMVLALATFSWAAGYNTKLKEIRNVTNDGKYIISEIAKDVRLANGSANGGEEGEVSFVNCVNGAIAGTITCTKLSYGTETDEKPGDDQDGAGTYIYDHETCRDANCWNGLYILQKSQGKAIIYFTKQDGDNYNLKKTSMNLPVATLVNLPVNIFNSINQEKRVSVKVDFYGMAGSKSRKFQPFFSIEANSRSWNFADLDLRSRFDFQFETEVETRDYNLI